MKGIKGFLIIYVLYITFFAIIGILLFRSISNQMETVKSYSILKMEEPFYGLVESVIPQSEIKASDYSLNVNFENDIKRNVTVVGCISHDRLLPREVIKKGAEVSKNVNSDTILIKFQSGEYQFILQTK